MSRVAEYVSTLEQELMGSLTREVRYRTFIAELCDNDCPEEYKRIVFNEIFGE